MDTVQGDKFVIDCAKWIRYNEAKLGDIAGPSASSIGTWINPVNWMLAGGTASTPNPSQGNAARPGPRTRTMSTLASSTSKPQAAPLRPMSFRVTSHHLYYLLIRCEALGLPIGSLDVRIPKRSRPSTYFAFISNNAAGATIKKRDREETMSVSSLQTTMSAFGLGGSAKGKGSWWSGEKHDITADVRFIYSSMTKLPALRIGPPPLKLIRDFEDCPGEMSVPLDAFKNVQILEFEDADPRAFLGWDRLSMQLRSLSFKRSGVEDVSDIIIDAVLNDGKRRRGEKIPQRKRKVHASEETEESEGMQSSTDTSNGVSSEATGGVEEETEIAEPLPSLSWHFLRHLSLSDNSLTFVHHSPIAYITNLTSIDLSHNLLNAVPPSLSALTKLRSLNISNNLIDSVLGIPDSIPLIEALNLSHNRLESLCGLERLTNLSRVDLRSNEVFEAGEIGRLATLEYITEVFIAGNPLLEEEDDARVLVFAEFAKEGRILENIKLDGESIGYFEKQRVKEIVPNMDRLAMTRNSKRTPKGTPGHRNETPLASELAKLAKSSVIVKNVRHRGGAGHGRRSTNLSGHPSHKPEDGGQPAESSSHIQAQTTTSRTNAAQRRNRRVVELAESVHEGEEGDTSKSRDDHPKREQSEASDSDLIKKAALAGNTDVAMGSVTENVAKPATHESNRTENELNSYKGGSDANKAGNKYNVADKNGKTNITKEGNTNTADAAAGAKGNDKVSATKQVQPPSSGNESNLTSQELRRKIEALKGEVGDDWMRLLARGEST
ncbi:uncharacterized protein FA14DRAFT_141057 [Meira miltonrushii]|uniref:L domain-like protein n=1 Tax=Meira miltonrushii TaxID=1280837 RepID=A0A316VIH3_9BASI|nr:uncharacterized protein FA14DRAFT_141057 [Meira miltonrushii]PWN37054.1 hypothetical protein FA14DRAFT_141057 [Meira miltonrushii]